MSSKQIKKEYVVFLFSSFIVLFLSSCELPISESDLPEEEWEIVSITYNQSNSTLYITVDSPEDNVFNKYHFYRDYALSEGMNWTEVIGLPFVDSIDKIYTSASSIKVRYFTNTRILSDMNISFLNTWFYKSEYDGLISRNVRAKVCISISSFPVTILE